MTPRDLLAESAVLVLGEKWQRPLARLLAVDDRLVRRWAAGDRPVPAWALERLRSELEKRGAAIEAALACYLQAPVDHGGPGDRRRCGGLIRRATAPGPRQ